MSLTLLFDLDDTLLGTNIETFVPAYFQALSTHMAPYVSPDKMLPTLIAGMQLMMESANPSRTLQDVFDEDFYGKLGIPKDKLADAFDDFYDNIFPTIESKTDRFPDAVPLIDWAFSMGYCVAIATDPLFLRKATQHRLRWAGFDPAQFDLVSTNENFHFSKSHPAYYAEVLGQLGWPEGPVLMVGNDVERDLLPAHRLGLKTYLINGEAASGPGIEAGRGKLADLRPWLESTDLSTLEPSFKSRDAILAIMRSVPAVLQSISSSITEEQWKHAPSSQDWALNEIICHLRDTDREIHQMQLQLMLSREDAFIPRPDTTVWASERDYLHENGVDALREFASVRMETLALMESVDAKTWSRKARHAIFGPTNFLEVSGFMADHDRMHIQQAWKTLESLQNERV